MCKHLSIYTYVCNIYNVWISLGVASLEIEQVTYHAFVDVT